jgi:lambda family phage tail tape measure protein
MGYRMGGAPAPAFPIDGPLRGLTGPTGSTAAAASLTEAISKYRKAADNFWFSETSTFQTIRNIIGSGAQVAASKGALALSNVRLNTAGLTAAATKLTNLPSTTISNISALLSGQGAKLTTTLQASGTQLRTQFTKLQTSADTLKTSTAQIFTGIGTGLTQRASTFRTGLTANLPFFGGGGGSSGGPPIPPFPPSLPPPPPPLPPTGGSSESFAKLNNGLKEFGPLSQRSLKSLQDLGGALQELRSELSPLDAEYKQVNRAIQQQEQLIQRETSRRQRRQRAPLTGMQTAQGVGAAISGGIFGGPEGLLGGLGGLAVGGVGGAFAGAAAGAQVGMFRQQIAATGEYAASIGKMQIALRGVAGSQDAYDTAIRAAAAATRELNVPQEEATRGLTRLSAAVLGAGGTMGDATFAFRSISEAIKATGGNAEQVDGALLALTQVFSKGKVSAEELNQIAERLPGTFTLFAQAAGKTGPELQKALQQGEVGLIDLMKFLDLAGERFGGTALKISGSSEEAGARLTVAFQAMRLEVGRAVLPLGAELQEAFAGFITSTTPGTVAAIGSIAGALQFLIGNDIAAAIGGIVLKLGAATLALKAFQAAAATTAGINLVNMLTGVGTGASITGGLFGAAVPKVNGFKAALTGLAGVFKSLAPFALLTFNIDLVIRNFNQLKETEAAIKKIREGQSTSRPGLIGPVPLNTAERQFTGASSETVAAAQQKQQVFVAKLREDLKLLERQAKAVDTFIPDTNPISRALGIFGLDPSANFKKQKQDAVELQKLKITQAEEILNLETRNYKTQAQQDAARRKSLEERFKSPAGSNEEAEKNREKLRDAFNKREDAMLEARQQREEKLADIRVQAAEQAKQIEEDLADTRRSLERELEDMARNRAYAAEDSERRIRGFRGEDPRLISAEQEIADIFRESRETAITNERRFSDEQEEQDRKIAEFQQNIAKSIREANDAHTKKMGDIQKQYAKEVAKIVEKGGATSGKSIEQGGTVAAQQLILAGKITSLNNQRAQLEQNRAQFTGATGMSLVPIPRPVPGKDGLTYPGVDQNIVPSQFREIDRQLDLLERKLQDIIKRAATPEPAGPSSSAGPNRKPNQNGAQSSLPGEVPLSFDVSKLGQTFGDTASAAFMEGLLAQQPRPYQVGDRVGYDRPVSQQIDMPGAVPLGVQGYVPATVDPAAAATTELRGTAEAAAETTRVATQTDRIAEAYAQVNEESARLTLSLNEQLSSLGSQRKYLDEGFSEGLSRSLAAIDESSFADLEALNKKFNDTIAKGGEGLRAEAEALRNAELAILEKNLQTNVELTKELERQNNLLKTRQDDRIGLGMQEGVQSYLESIGTMRDATNQLTVQGIKGLEDAIYDLVTTGTTNFRELAANMLRETARMIIQQLVLRNILMMVKNAFGFANGGVFGPSMQPVAGYAKGGTFTKTMVSTYAKGGIFDEYAAGGAFAENKIVPFAQGGAFTNSVVTKPTFFKFAAGGAMQNGVMGEAGPEAVLPLKRGPDGRLGVTGTSNSSAGPTNVTVNVDASGSKVQGDSNKSEQLGRAVSQAVQEELVRQKLPGGLLS